MLFLELMNTSTMQKQEEVNNITHKQTMKHDCGYDDSKIGVRLANKQRQYLFIQIASFALVKLNVAHSAVPCSMIISDVHMHDFRLQLLGRLRALLWPPP